MTRTLRAAEKARQDAQGSKSIGTETRFVQAYTTRESEVLVGANLVKAREIEVSRLATETNLVDMGTKHLPSHRLESLKSLMGRAQRTR